MVKKAIWRYTINLTDKWEYELPAGTEILTVQWRHGQLSMWALITPTNPTVRRTIAIYGTGHKLPDSPGTYIGTVQEADSLAVWHIFDKGESDGHG